MTHLTYAPLPTATVAALRAGGPDANGQPPERATSDGNGNPCRYCLRDIPKDAPMLICAHRPFDTLHPYAECGPIFLCADNCAAHSGSTLPEILTTSASYLLKGYTPDQRIHYGTGQITPAADIATYAAALLARDQVAFVDVRSASNNCFMTRITLRK